MEKPYLIGIAGESGVGKSTMASIISLFFDTKSSVILSTDDLHKWERGNPAWKEITHLNPEANNLDLGDLHLQDLSSGKHIYRSHYNHETGFFDPPQKINPENIIIVEGLHAFYTEISKKLLNLKIFVDTDEDLRVHWKIVRDTEERGYTYNTALESINKRKRDGDLIRKPQIEAADLVIKLKSKNKINTLGSKSEKIVLDVDFKIQNQNSEMEKLIKFIENYIEESNYFISLCENIGKDLSLCQNGGGNISVKLSDDLMIIKSSGFALKDVSKTNGYSIINYKPLCSITSEEEYNNFLSSFKKRPSMEIGFHALLKKYVIHIHPIYLTLLLSLQDSKITIPSLFKEKDYFYIDYLTPGYDLFDYFKSIDLNRKIYFLANHGIIISSDDAEDFYSLIQEIEGIIRKNYNLLDFNLEFNKLKIEDQYAFPDAVIFGHDVNKKEIIAAHNYINYEGKKIGQMRWLTATDILKLKSLEAEKYRKGI